MSVSETLCIVRIETHRELYAWIPQLVRLITPWLPVLQDDYQDPLQKAEVLLSNLLPSLPYLWILHTRQGNVVASASLTQVTPGRYAYIHGVKSAAYRKHPATKMLVSLVFEEAFTHLRLHKLKAEFEADNPGPLGFCRLYHFTKEAHFKEDNLLQGQRKDVVVYSLFSSTYHQQAESTKGGHEYHVIR